MADVDKNTEVIYTIDGSDSDGKYKEGDDLKDEVVETLATYLHCLSKEEKNAFTISPGVQKRSVDGPLDDTVSVSENPYAPTATTDSLRNVSDSGKIFQPSVDEFLTKGEADTFIRDLPSGSTNRAGSSAEPSQTQGQGPVFDAIRTALDGNRFSPGVNGPFASGENVKTVNPTLGGLNDRNYKDLSVMGRLQDSFGTYKRDGKDISTEDLQKIGDSLMLRAAKEIKAVQEGDPNSGVVAAGALVPGAAQISLLRVDTNEVKASRVMEENFGLDPKPKTALDEVAGQGTKSWGHMNTPLEPYSGFLPIGMTTIAVALTVAIRVVAFAFVSLLGTIVKESDAKVPTRGPFIAGEYGKEMNNGGLFNLQMIGIQPTERDFLTVVNEGLDLFFAFDGANFLRVVREPQFFAIFTRNIIRSGNIIINEVRDVFSKNQNPLAAAQAFLGLVDVLKSSKIIAFLNIMAQMGDKAAELRDQGFEPNERKISSLENLDPENMATNVMRIRNSRSDLHSGMDSTATLSKFLFPTSYLRASSLEGFQAFNALAGLPGSHVANSDDLDSNGRIKREVVEEIETQLESDYVPFYFHDLRTNEIISFHAFLSTLEETYTPTFESTQAYGRIDNVRTYASTERTITVSFKVAAMSKEDFDYMWWKINKLVTLVYPSWTKGRQVSSGDSVFTQPFSQIPASTPVIRFRVGDIMKTNFSKLSLMRLFGAGEKENEFNLLPYDQLNSKDYVLTATQNAIRTIRERMLRNPALTNDAKDGYQSGQAAILLPKRTGYQEAPGLAEAALDRVKSLLGQSGKKRLVITANTKVRIKRVIGGAAGAIGAAASLISEALGSSPGKYGEHQIAYYVVNVDGDVPSEMEGDFLVSHYDLTPDPGYIGNSVNASNKSINKAIPDSASGLENNDSVITIGEEPFNPDNNAIVRSFQSNQGKGLAGVITNLSFTEMAGTNVWETAEYGSRAPKMFTVNMTFAVIHDIAPGIDHTGFNRAPLYPVGEVARRMSGKYYEEKSGKSSFEQDHKEASVSLRNGNAKGGDTKGPKIPGGL